MYVVSKTLKMKKKKKKRWAYNTQYSQAVTHPSTNCARCCLTSVIGREPVHSTWYGRRHLLATFKRPYASQTGSVLTSCLIVYISCFSWPWTTLEWSQRSGICPHVSLYALGRHVLVLWSQHYVSVLPSIRRYHNFYHLVSRCQTLVDCIFKNSTVHGLMGLSCEYPIVQNV